VSVVARAELRELVSRQSVLPHLVGIGVTRSAQADRRQFVEGTHKAPAMCRSDLVLRWVTSVAVVTLNSALSVHALREGPALVRMADDAAIRAVLRQALLLEP
jgi:hypothetical protein